MAIGVLTLDIVGMIRWKEYKMKRISIIVPVYNAEKYLEETLDSIAAQTYPEFEVILVDDGSTDGSGEICRAQVAADSRFHYYRKENGGPSAARNTGLFCASGEYVGFCDGDDRIDPAMYQTMVSCMERHAADIALCDIYSERDQRRFGFLWEDETVFREDEIGQNLVAAMVGNESDNDKNVPLWGSVVRCLFRADIIAENGIQFPEELHFAEDLVFTLQYLRNAQGAVVCNRDFYWYRCNPASIMNSFYRYKKGMFRSRKQLLDTVSEIISGFSCQEILQKRLITTARCYFRDCVGNACRPAEDRTEADIKAELKEILNDDGVSAAFAEFDAADLKTRLIYSLIKHKMAHVIKIYYAYRFGKG